MRPGNFTVLLAAGVGGLLVLSGCGKGDSAGPCVPVKGRVTLGSRPLVGGTVTFIPLDGGADRPRPEGSVDSLGFYAVATAGVDGAPVGKYRATLTISGEDKKQNGQFDPRYSHWEKSPLLIEVKENPAAGAYDLTLVPRRGR